MDQALQWWGQSLERHFGKPIMLNSLEPFREDAMPEARTLRRQISCSLNSLKGARWGILRGTIVGVIEGVLGV